MMTEYSFLVLEEIADFLNRFFAIKRYSQEERGGIYLPSTRPVKRLGLALEPWMQLQEWVSGENLDAMFLHRPWQLEPGQLAPDIGVISYHLAFDERLTFSFNPRLAEVLGMSGLEVLGEKDTRPIGMIGDIPEQSFSVFCRYIHQVFGGYEQIGSVDDSDEVGRIAIVGAMSNSLIREAVSRGVDIYITGQLRKSAEQALLETKIKVIAVGHRRGEAWGLRALAGVLRERWSAVEVVLFDN